MQYFPILEWFIAFQGLKYIVYFLMLGKKKLSTLFSTQLGNICKINPKLKLFLKKYKILAFK